MKKFIGVILFFAVLAGNAKAHELAYGISTKLDSEGLMAGMNKAMAYASLELNIAKLQSTSICISGECPIKNSFGGALSLDLKAGLKHKF